MLAALLLAGFGAACSEPSPAPTARVPAPVPGVLAEGAWQAGVASGPLFAPEGLSMGGFGFRVAPDGPRNERLGATVGRYQTLLVKALALSNGHAGTILVKLPMIFPTDLLRRRTLAWMEAESGYDFADQLVLTATHTHSGPARFWALPYGVGLFGLDEYDPAVLDALARSIAEVAWAAWQDLAPARVGAAERLRFDPENRINRDRRSQNIDLYTDESDPNVYFDGSRWRSKDHRFWLLRIDDAEGNPRAALFRLGIHGTHYMHQLYSEDAPGNLERGVEAALGVPMAMFVQGAGGDVSPAGGEQGREAAQIMEALGRRVGAVAASVWPTVETRASGELAVAHRRRVINREVLGYRDDEFGVQLGNVFRPYAYGGFQCGEFGADPEPDDANPETTLVDGSLGCIGLDELQGVLGDPSGEGVELPPTEMEVAVLSALRIDDWHIVTLPGEPVSQLDSYQHRIATAAGFTKLSSFGYAQTHLLYLTPSEDWWQGGYEAAQNIWGWKLGEFLADQNLELLQRLARFGHEPAWDGDLPFEPLPRESEWRDPQVRDSRDPDGMTMDERETWALRPIRARWTGGDPWIDRAVVSLEHETAAGWITVDTDAGWGWRLLADLSTWPLQREVLWEPATDTTPGRYRFRVAGHWSRAGEIRAYELATGPFAVLDAPILEVTAATRPGEGIALYPAFVSNPQDFDMWLPEEGLIRWQTAGFRLVADDWGPNDSVPVTGATFSLRGSWQPGLEPIEAEVDWDGDCSCYFWAVSAPVGATAASWPGEGLQRAHWFAAGDLTAPAP